MKPVDVIKQTLVKQGFSQPVKDYKEKLLDVGTKVIYLYEPGELEGQQYGGEGRKRSTDPIWLVDVYKIKNRYVQKYQPMLYYLDGGYKMIFCFRKLQPHSGSLVIRSLTRPGSFCFQWVFSWDMYLAYSIFLALSIFFQNKID